MTLKSLRTKLFLSIGIILILVAFLCYLLPEIFLRKDLDAAARYINNFFSSATADQKVAISQFFKEMRDGLVEKISLNLIATIVLSMAIAFFLLARISKKITKPIAELAKASEDISEGKFEKAILPNIDKRQDEVAVLVHSFQNMVIALQDREKVRGVLNKVVSKEIAGELLKSDIELAGEERVTTMLFSDIRDFTRLSNGFAPRYIIERLNEYMTRMCEIIDETKGVVDKFVGDEIMALYGTPLPLENHADKAIEAALKMMKEVQKWNEELKKEGKLTFDIGIGIHTGLVFSGNMGAQNRLNYTVIGANVNLASRLCSKALPKQIIVSEETKNASNQSQFTFKQLPPLSLKGVEHPVAAYEILDRK